ncbi:hypothetical protein L9F63_014295, partial [Diploptera punctata]
TVRETYRDNKSPTKRLHPRLKKIRGSRVQIPIMAIAFILNAEIQSVLSGSKIEASFSFFS